MKEQKRQGYRKMMIIQARNEDIVLMVENMVHSNEKFLSNINTRELIRKNRIEICGPPEEPAILL